MADTQEVHFTRVYAASRELVWEAWTVPERIAGWWGTEGWSVDVTSIEADPRPGGSFRVTVVNDSDGTEIPTIATYLEVDPPARAVLEEPAASNWHEGSVNTLTLTDLGDGRTQMDVHIAIQTSDEMRRVAEAGITANFERLADYLTAAATTGGDR